MIGLFRIGGKAPVRQIGAVVAGAECQRSWVSERLNEWASERLLRRGRGRLGVGWLFWLA